MDLNSHLVKILRIHNSIILLNLIELKKKIKFKPRAKKELTLLSDQNFCGRVGV